jgi:GMP reductase
VIFHFNILEFILKSVSGVETCIIRDPYLLLFKYLVYKMEPKLDFSDVLVTPRSSSVGSRQEVYLTRTFKFKYSPYSLECVPLMAANMDTVGSIEMMRALSKCGVFTCLHKFITLDEFRENAEFMKEHPDSFAVTIGYSASEIDWLALVNDIIDFKVICIDVANGHLKGFVRFCKQIRDLYPEKIIIAGNVCTPEGVEALITDGQVDVVKCGIGGGSACTTRIKTGVGFPQFSAAAECSKVARELGASIVSDGGITCPGDAVKAFGVGADFVMVGGQFAGHTETPGEIIVENDKLFKEFYGMSSERAMTKNYGEKKAYRTSEGRCMKIPYKGDVSDTLSDFLGGIRSACTYTDCRNIEEMTGGLDFIRVNHQYNQSLLH